jgi:hypothetical protein
MLVGSPRLPAPIPQSFGRSPFVVRCFCKYPCSSLLRTASSAAGAIAARRSPLKGQSARCFWRRPPPQKKRLRASARFPRPAFQLLLLASLLGFRRAPRSGGTSDLNRSRFAPWRFKALLASGRRTVGSPRREASNILPEASPLFLPAPFPRWGKGGRVAVPAGLRAPTAYGGGPPGAFLL